MSAMRPEPVEVQLNDGRPGRFVWRGRLYTVLAVIQRPGEASPPDDQFVDEHEHRPGDWRCWRVTASPGKKVPAVGFRLCHDQAAGRWLLTRDGG